MADRFNELLDKMRTLHDAKRADYTGGNDDILYNYRTSGNLAGIGVQKAIFSRLCEKVVRLSQTLGKGVAVTAETQQDTCLDLAIISLLLLIALEEPAWPFEPIDMSNPDVATYKI